jgi:hypothetical protein
MIKEALRDIVGGSGGPNGNAIPVYSDHNAPHGGQAIGSNGQPLMLANSEVSGIHYVIVDPSLITQEENDNDKFMTFKDNGEVNYIRIWVMGEDGHGVPIVSTGETWVEYTHLKLYEPDTPPEPVTGKSYRLELTVTGTITEIN